MAIKALLPEDVKYLVVHCSATPPNHDLDVKQLDRMHRDRGFVMIGYHYVIRRDGELQIGRDLKLRGAHVEDYNHCSVGICMVGGVDGKLKPQNNFTDAQFIQLHTLLYQLKVLFPEAEIRGHRDFPNVAKACPSFDVGAWLHDVGLA